MEPVRHVRQTVSLPYRWSYGRNLTHFFRELRDNRRFVGRRCPKCRAVHIPPAEVCGRCFERCLPEWIEVGPGGVLHSYTTVHLPFPGQPTEPPYIFAMIQLDGSDTHLSHLVGEADESELSIGQRVEPVWNEVRRGGLHDVVHFRPVREAEAPGPAPIEEESSMSLTSAVPDVKPRSGVTVRDVFEAMPTRFQAGAAGDWATTIQFEIAGDLGGDWVVEIAGGECKTHPGRAQEAKATVATDASTWVGMVTGSVNPQMAFMTGKLKIKGNMADVMKISNPKIFPKDPS